MDLRRILDLRAARIPRAGPVAEQGETCPGKTCCSLLELERRRIMLTRLMLSDPRFACCTNASCWARESTHPKKKGRPRHAISSCPALRVSGGTMETPQNCSAARRKSRRNRLLLFRITFDHGRCASSHATCRAQRNHLPRQNLLQPSQAGAPSHYAYALDAQ